MVELVKRELEFITALGMRTGGARARATIFRRYQLLHNDRKGRGCALLLICQNQAVHCLRKGMICPLHRGIQQSAVPIFFLANWN